MCVTCSYNAFNIGTFAASSIYMLAIKMAHKRWEKNGKIQQLFSFYVIFFFFWFAVLFSLLFGSRALHMYMYALHMRQRYCECNMYMCHGNRFYMCAMPVSPSAAPFLFHISPRNIFAPQMLPIRTVFLAWGCFGWEVVEAVEEIYVYSSTYACPFPILYISRFGKRSDCCVWEDIKGARYMRG